MNCCTFHGLGSLANPDGELTSRITNPFIKHFGRILWTQTASKQDLNLNRAPQHKKADIHILMP
jgi:hypothetical protein